MEYDTPHLRRQYASEYVAEHGVDVSSLQPNEVAELVLWDLDDGSAGFRMRIEATLMYWPHVDVHQSAAILDAFMEQSREVDRRQGIDLLPGITQVAPELGIPRWHRGLQDEDSDIRETHFDRLTSAVYGAVPKGWRSNEHPGSFQEDQEDADEAVLLAESGLTKQDVRELVHTYGRAEQDFKHPGRSLHLGRAAFYKLLQRDGQA